MIEQDFEELLLPTGGDDEIQAVANIGTADKGGAFALQLERRQADHIFLIADGENTKLGSAAECIPPHPQPLRQNEKALPAQGVIGFMPVGSERIEILLFDDIVLIDFSQFGNLLRPIPQLIFLYQLG